MPRTQTPWSGLFSHPGLVLGAHTEYGVLSRADPDALRTEHDLIPELLEREELPPKLRFSIIVRISEHRTVHVNVDGYKSLASSLFARMIQVLPSSRGRRWLLSREPLRLMASRTCLSSHASSGFDVLSMLRKLNVGVHTETLRSLPVTIYFVSRQSETCTELGRRLDPRSFSQA
jgi:hypothetical protein